MSDPEDFLSNLDVSLAACRTCQQLDEIWDENLEIVCGLGVHPRQKAELLYERHRSRITEQMNLLVEAADRALRAAA